MSRSIRNIAQSLGWTRRSLSINGKPRFEEDEHKCYREILKKVKDTLEQQSRIIDSDLEEFIQILAQRYGPQLDCWNQSLAFTNNPSWPKDKTE